MQGPLANPVSAGLVERGRQWPGLRTAPADVAGAAAVRVTRPLVFLRESGTMPESVTLRTVRPAIFAERSDRELARLVTAAVDECEAAARTTMVKAGRRVLGVAGVRAQRPSDRPANAEPRRGLNPRAAARNKWRRIEALRRLKQFIAHYRIAYADWKRGVRDVAFPAGCYAMRVFQGALVADSA